MTVGSTFKLLHRHWLTVAFVLGFITDTILLNQIDNLVDNLILLFYALLSTTALLLLYVGVAERGPGFLTRFFKRFAPVGMQYAFGGLLSGMLIFYGRSGDWVASAPFLLIILAVIFGNEFVSKRSDRLVYHIALYFIGVFSYIVLVVPVITGKMGDGIFILSGLIALMIVTFVVQVLFRIVPNFMAVNTQRVIFTVASIYIGFNALYFTSLIPPIPLSLTQLEMVQSVETYTAPTGNKIYRIETEEQPWYRRLPLTRPILHPTGSSIACYARVYAPTKLETDIYHRWEYKDVNGDWQEHFRYGYTIAGTNEGGYRGYTRNTSFFSGLWRCSVETKRGQVLGREVVRIDTTGEPKDIKVTVE
ncbi:MAG: DUF2914 domain-containing protein [Candidatus Kaiserbacteria bacterium]|nr:DUF2914 domain-containing protein [Candidatus Kaiserbacteria bacterium]MCB9816380.1 DUF2914 domain-containing protein [Candidatus Nomurabacteria bacterium]